MNITPEMLKAMNAAQREVDGLISLSVVPAINGILPAGKKQSCDDDDLPSEEWVDQRQYGEDSFAGTVTWEIGKFWLVAEYST